MQTAKTVERHHAQGRSCKPLACYISDAGAHEGMICVKSACQTNGTPALTEDNLLARRKQTQPRGRQGEGWWEMGRAQARSGQVFRRCLARNMPRLHLDRMKAQKV